MKNALTNRIQKRKRLVPVDRYCDSVTYLVLAAAKLFIIVEST
jgi:hypothetical protein